MSPLFRRSAPRVRAQIALHGPRRAAVLLHPAPERWPDHEREDRLAMAVGGLAVAARHTTPTRWEPFLSLLPPLARGIAAAQDGIVPGGIVILDPLGPVGALDVVAWEGPGRLGVEMELVGSAVGPVPRLTVRPREAGPGMEIAALALAIAVAVDSDEDRLALGLAIEGLVAWHRESDRLNPPRDALAFALGHAGARLQEVGRVLPVGL